MGDDPQILDYEDEILHRSDLRSLGEGCWLSDAAISFYLANAHKEIFGSPDAIQALPPSMAFLLIHSAGSDVADIVQPLRLAEVRPCLPRVVASLTARAEQREYVLLPLNDNADVSRGYGGSHWCRPTDSRPCAARSVTRGGCAGRCWSSARLHGPFGTSTRWATRFQPTRQSSPPSWALC